MNDILEIFIVSCGLIFTTHFALLMLTNKRRIRKLIIFVEQFRDKNLLTTSEYDYPYNRYTSFFSYMEFFPDKDDYKALYENQEFSMFVDKTRKRLTYYALVAATSLAFLLIVTH